MSTWTCKRVAFCLCLGLVMAACQQASGGFMSSTSGQRFDNPRRNMALPSAELVDGALTLAPPPGFCVDKRSLEPSFAIVARCDSLGARRALPSDVPLGMILVSASLPAERGVDLARALARLQPPGAEILVKRVAGSLALMQLRGATPEGIDRRHWRALARIGPYLVGLTAFAPPGGELSGQEGGRVLSQLVESSESATATRAIAAVTPSEPSGPQPGGFLSGLFE